MNNKDVAKFLYDQRVAQEKAVDNPEGEALALFELLDEINTLGYDFHYFADIDLRPIKDVKVIKLLWKYLPRMESIVTIETFLRKIDPKIIPEALDYAIVLFSDFSPTDKMLFTSFDGIISRGKRNEEYFNKICKLLNDGDSYAAMSETRQMMGKHCPNLLRKYTDIYREGVLLPATLNDCVYFTDDETTLFLNRCINITSSELIEIIGKYDYKDNDYKYPISVTCFEHWKRLCTADFIHQSAKRIIKKRAKKLNKQ